MADDGAIHSSLTSPLTLSGGDVTASTRDRVRRSAGLAAAGRVLRVLRVDACGGGCVPGSLGRWERPLGPVSCMPFSSPRALPCSSPRSLVLFTGLPCGFPASSWRPWSRGLSRERAGRGGTSGGRSGCPVDGSRRRPETSRAAGCPCAGWGLHRAGLGRLRLLLAMAWPAFSSCMAFRWSRGAPCADVIATGRACVHRRRGRARPQSTGRLR